MAVMVGIAASAAGAGVHALATTQVASVGGLIGALVPILLGAYVRAAVRAATEGKASLQHGQ